MAQQFETQAIIRLIDEVSGPLRKLSGTIHDYNAAAARAARHAAQEQITVGNRVAEAMKTAATAGTLAFGRFATHAMKDIAKVGYEADKVMTQIRMFTKDMTPEAVDKVQAFMAQNAGKYTKGLVEYEKGVLAAQRAAFPIQDTEKLAAISKPAAVFAKESNTDFHTAMEQLLDHMNMMKEATVTRNGKRMVVPVGDLDAKEIEHLGIELTGRLAKWGQLSHQNTQQMYQMMKFMGPVMHGTHSNLDDMMVAAVALGRAGIKGEELGNTMKMAMSRAVQPTNKARALLTAYDINLDKYFTYDRTKINPESFTRAAQMRGGTLPKETTKAIAQAAQAFKDEKASFYQTQLKIADALVASGSKSFKNRVTASNFAADLMIGSVAGGDLLGLLKAINGNVGLLNAIFGKERGGRLAALSPEDLAGLEEMRKKAKEMGSDYDIGNHAWDEMQKAFAQRVDNMVTSIEGAQVRMFEPFKGALGEAADAISKFAQLISAATPKERTAITLGAGAAGLAATVWGALKTWGFFNDLVKSIKNPPIPQGVPAPVATGGSAAAKTAETGVHAAFDATTRAGAKTGAEAYVAQKMLEMERAAALNPGAFSRTLGFLSKAVAVLGPILMIRDIGEIINPTTPENYKYRNDITITPEMWEKSRRAQAELKQGTDMEAARGRAMMRHPGGVQPEWNVGPQTKAPPKQEVFEFASMKDLNIKSEVTGTVSGDATVHNIVDIHPSPLFEVKMKEVAKSVVLPLIGKLGDVMSGSNGTRAPNVGMQQ